MRKLLIFLTMLMIACFDIQAQKPAVELVATVFTDLLIDYRVVASGNAFMRTSPFGVVLALHYGGLRDRTKVALVQGDKVTEKILENGRFAQGVLSDDTTMYFVTSDLSDSFLVSFNTSFENYKKYTSNRTGGRILGTSVTAVNGDITAVDSRSDCLVKRKEDTTYFNVYPSNLYRGPAEAFTIGDTTYSIYFDGVTRYPHDTLRSMRLINAWGRINTDINISIVDDSVRWIGLQGKLYSISSVTNGFAERAGTPFEQDPTFAIAGRNGLLYLNYGPADTSNYRYSWYGSNAGQNYWVGSVSKSSNPVVGRRSGGWSQGYFYIAVIEDTNKVGVYRIKEPEPPVSVEEELTEVSAEVDAPQKLSMTAEEFVEWRKHRAAHTTYTDVNGKRLDAIAVVRAGVVMVREGVKIFVVLVE